jgi:4-diphosphocytidyl-2-C-methyl-D-erythritol kinase
VLRDLPALPDCHVVICKPGFSISTPELFHHIDERKSHTHPDTDGMLRALEQGELRGVTQRMYNVFEDVLPKQRRGGINDLKSRLLDLGAMGTMMSGTGSAVFGIFDDRNAAQEAKDAISQRVRECFLTRPNHSIR